jgi:hypothetical protein
MGLRAWSAPPLARALLRVTPPAARHYQAAAKLAFGGQSPPAELQRSLVGALGRFELLDFARTGDDRLLLLTAQSPPDSSGLSAGAQYVLRLREPEAPDAGSASSVVVSLVEAPAIRWHQGRLETLELGEGRRGVLITLERTAPGAGAPLEVGTTLVSLPADGRPEILMTKVTGEEREEPLGCRRGWREKIVSLHDQDGDGELDSVRLTRTEFVKQRLESAAGSCSERQGSPGLKVVPLRPRLPAQQPRAAPDAGDEPAPSHPS